MPVLLYRKDSLKQARRGGKRGTPPCKSGQLKKDLGLEVSSARHAVRLARLITFASLARLDFIIGAFMFYLSGIS